MTYNENEKKLLNEILPKPANVLIADRFDVSNASNEHAACNGKCISGTCRTIAD